jgi:hypothetical protein
VRTFDYTVRPATSLDDIYWSNYETIDPALGSQYSSCDQYYQSGSSPSSTCVIEFDTADVLDGPVFSNDTFRTCGSPTFESTIESGNPNLAAGYVGRAKLCQQYSGLQRRSTYDRGQYPTANIHSLG